MIIEMEIKQIKIKIEWIEIKRKNLKSIMITHL